jgi:hypothetical protein
MGAPHTHVPVFTLPKSFPVNNLLASERVGHRSHSGQYGIVSSEEGFQNLTRFLFGSSRGDGFLDMFDVLLPDEVQEAYLRNNDSVRASCRF